MMKRKHLFLTLILALCSVAALAQQKSELQQRAETADESGTVPTARFYYIRAFEDYAAKGQFRPGVECAAKGAALYYKENYYKEAFDLLRRADQTSAGEQNEKQRAALFYLTTRERLNMYVKMRKSSSALEQLGMMADHAAASADEQLKSDLLYQKAICYYTFGMSAKGDEAFRQMAGKLTATKEYDKVDQAYQQLIANGRRSGSTSLLAQSYRSYIAWKDSVSALKTADEIAALKQQIADHEATIAEKDGSLTARMAIIVALGVLAAALAVALVVGALVLMRYIFLNRRQKKNIAVLTDNNAMKAHFISNISAQLTPTLQKLDSRTPEVKALLQFAEHVQTLSDLENNQEPVELQDTQVPALCEQLMEQIRGKVRQGVTLTVDAQKMSVRLNREYVSHILLHLLQNAAEYAPAEGKIVLDFKKRSAHKYQFTVSNTGETIPDEKHEDIFKPFLEARDLTTGDGLGLPICRQMALKMNGDLCVDPTFTRGTRFMLVLYA